MSTQAKYSKAPHTVDVDSIHEDFKSSRRGDNAEARWVDGSKYGRTLYLEGVTDNGTEYNARVSVLIQTWEDINAEGQFVHTTAVRIENFSEVNAYLPRRFTNVHDEVAHNSGLTPEERELEEAAQEAAQEKLDQQVVRYLESVQYAHLDAGSAKLPFAAGARTIVAAIKRAAVNAHLNLR
jgi:hypothetical protein